MGITEKIAKDAGDIVFVYTICGSLEEARALGFSCIEEKHAISMDYWIVHSIYPWQGFIREIDQYMLMFSTQKVLSDNLIKHIESEHKYKVPMIARCTTNMTNVSFNLWVEDTLKSIDKLKTEEDLYKKEDINSLKNLK